MYPFGCEGCGTTLKLTDKHLGRKIKCPKCESILQVPESPEEFDLVQAEVVENSSADPFGDLSNYYPDNSGGAGYTPNYSQHQPAASSGQGMDRPSYLTSQPAYEQVKQKGSGGGSWDVNWGTVGFGGLMMLGAVVWFVGGLFAGVIFFYPPILLIIGLVTTIKGLFGGD